MIKVILIGPLDPEVPEGDLKLLTGGETTYIRTLLQSPPNGIVYTHWSKALKKREIEFTLIHHLVSILVKLRILPISSGSFCIRVAGDYDMIHAHSNSIKIIGRKIPIVLSDSSSNYLFLRDYLNWPQWRINFGYFLRRKIFKILKIIDPDSNLEGAKKLIVFSEFAKKIHLKLGAAKTKVQVIHPGLSKMVVKRKKSIRGDVSILFVGTWFERKGGLIMLEAFKRLSKNYKNIQLTVVGPIPEKFKLETAKFKVQSYDYVPRERLLKDFYPNADIFALVPPRVEGYGFVVLEAMAFGIPVVVSNICALAELVDDGRTGFVVKPGSVDDLERKLGILIKSKTVRNIMGKAARRRFLENYLIQRSNEKLLEVYRQALS